MFTTSTITTLRKKFPSINPTFLSEVRNTFARELSVVFAAGFVVADDADEVLVDLPLALTVGGRRLLLLEDGGRRITCM